MKWNIGDRPWLADVGTKQVEKPCPICAGKLVVTLVLGTGEEVVLPCGYCGHGWEGPRGFITEYEFHSGAEQLTIGEIRTERTVDGEKTEYLFIGHRLAKDGDLFLNRDGAISECARLCATMELEQSTRAEYLKKDKQKSFAWNAGYHLREAKRAEEQVAYHRKKAILCKAKAKAEGGAS